MRFRKSQAYILKTFPFSETSLVVHALTPGEGRVHLLAKGARRGSARSMQGLEPFCRTELMWVEKEGRELQTLREAALVRGNGAWRGDLARWAMGCLFFEMADRAATAGERHGALFDLCRAFAAESERLAGEHCEREGEGGRKKTGGAKSIQSSDPIRTLAALLPFAYGVLRTQGLAPQVAKCVRCGSTRPPFPAIDLRQGGVLCAKCHGRGAPGGQSGARIRADGTNEANAPVRADRLGRSDSSELSDLSDQPEFFDDDAAAAFGPRWPLDEGTRRVLIDWLMKWRPAAPPPPDSSSPSAEPAPAPSRPLAVRLSARQARALLGLLDRLAVEHLDAPLKSLPLVARLSFLK